VDARGEQRRRAAARCTRDVWISPEEDGLANLIARLDALTAHAIRAAVDAAAADPEIAGACGATVGERRAEALAALVLGRAQVTAQLEVTVPVEALVGPGGAAVDGSTTASAVLPDGTLIGWDTAQDLFDDPAVRLHLRTLVVDDPSGRAIDLGRTRYEVSEPLRRWITARDRTCRFPGCRRRATACQIDHIQPWDHGGRTNAANLHALCVRHHQLKTHTGWQVTRDDPTGITTWTSPLGRHYDVDPVPALLHTAPPNDPDPPPF
jgi:hypothetical protein